MSLDKLIKKLGQGLYACSPAALYVLATQGFYAGRNVIGSTLNAASKVTSVHAIDVRALARAFAVEDSIVLSVSGWFDGSLAPLERFVIAQLAR